MVQSNVGNVVLLILLLVQMSEQFFNLGGHCLKNISVKYEVPVTKTRHTTSLNTNEIDEYSQQTGHLEEYVTYEDRIRWDIIHVCCPGYRTKIFGFCEPVCQEPCPPNSLCSEPNKCVCIRGYEASHHLNKNHNLHCRPICVGGCPEHSHCVGYNQCECRTGYKDVSTWFSSLRCEKIHCPGDQRYDITKHACVKIDMSVEELMQKVAEKLALGLDVAEDSELELED